MFAVIWRFTNYMYIHLNGREIMHTAETVEIVHKLSNKANTIFSTLYISTAVVWYLLCKCLSSSTLSSCYITREWYKFSPREKCMKEDQLPHVNYDFQYTHRRSICCSLYKTVARVLHETDLNVKTSEYRIKNIQLIKLEIV